MPFRSFDHGFVETAIMANIAVNPAQQPDSYLEEIYKSFQFNYLENLGFLRNNIILKINAHWSIL